jgi:hypothetical protein
MARELSLLLYPGGVTAGAVRPFAGAAAPCTGPGDR